MSLFSSIPDVQDIKLDDLVNKTFSCVLQEKKINYITPVKLIAEISIARTRPIYKVVRLIGSTPKITALTFNIEEAIENYNSHKSTPEYANA